MTPTERKRKVMDLANMDSMRPAAAITAPMMVTTRQPYLFTKMLAMGPAPRVMPTRMEGMREADPRSALNLSIRAIRKMPKE